jgi:hypothetical protein
MVVQKGSDGVAKPYWIHSGVRLRTRMSVTAKTASTSDQVSKWWLPVTEQPTSSSVSKTHDRQTAMFLKNVSIWSTEFRHRDSQFPVFLLGIITAADEADKIFRNLGNLLPKIRYTSTWSLFLRPTVHFHISIPQVRLSVPTISNHLYPVKFLNI